MRIAIMQPYLFPYLGYFQLLHCADAFVLLDDVAFIKRGWINRNRILVNGSEYLFTIPVASGSQNNLIRDTHLHTDQKIRRKALTTIRQAYSTAPGLAQVFPLIEQILLSPETDLTTLVSHSLHLINDYVAAPVPLLRSSAIDKDNKLSGQNRIIEICQRLGATEYVNASGGIDLYSAADFANSGIALRFLQPNLQPYPQGGKSAFVPGLSVIDLLMHNTPEQAKALFGQGTLL
ncbi:WbqC family protein [Hymenobacter latericus]|uniref:WbqC family protein n=1 Tax=Hymenobacter sp. YIM 151858-1 TaxID=2987688 RepID=UPI00222664A4|nr:WbqC family protein [Hymenobacter sp. YIM 151858-1]UYZ57364.1 WbqC family protein [Hymenobacter sp. YIM 151858-1]